MDIQRVQELATTTLAVSGALSVIAGLIYGATRFAIKRETLPTLEEQREKFKKFNDKLYEAELLRSERSAKHLEELQRSQEKLLQEFQAFNTTFARYEFTLSSLPVSLAKLDESTKLQAQTTHELGGILKDLTETVNDTRLQVARLEERIQAHDAKL